LSNTISGPQFKTRDTTFVNSKAKISLRGRDLESGVNRIEYSINGSDPIKFEEPFTIETEGVHIITYIGYDNVENTSSKALVLKVDNTGPSINHQFSTIPTGTIENKKEYPKYVILFLAGTDNVIGLESIKYGFGTSPPKNYTIPITGFSSGSKKMKFIAIDKLGNTTEQEVEFIIQD